MKKYPCPVTNKPDVYPRCTTIISDATNNSAPLIQWGANQVCQWIRENCKEDFNWGSEEKFYEVYEEELNNARFHFREVSQKALDIGSEVHNMIENYYKKDRIATVKIIPENIRDEVRNAFKAFIDWSEENDLKPIEVEKKVYGDKWAGTLDFYGFINGNLYIIDWKSSKAHNPEMRYQVAAYRYAHSYGLESDIRNPLATHNGVLRLDKETGLPDFKDHSKTYEQDLKVFNAMVDLYYLRHPRIQKAFSRHKEATE